MLDVWGKGVGNLFLKFTHLQLEDEHTPKQAYP